MIAASLGALALPALRTWREERAAFAGARHPVPRPARPADLMDVRLQAPFGRVAAWYAPSKNGAAIILAHGTGGDRAQLLPELEALADRGYGVLAFDWPGHGESEGEVRLGRPEREAFTAAVDFLAKRPEVTAGQVGAVGYSIGAALVAVAAADDPRVRAVVLVGGFTDALEQTRYEYQWRGWLASQVGMAVVRRYTEGGNLRPIDVAPKLRGREVLAIAGQEDHTVPPAMARQLAEASGGEAWIVPGCGHGGFAEAAPTEYPARLVAFFDHSLRAGASADAGRHP